MEYLKFYHETDPFGYFSNYWPCEIEIDGKKWPSSEHYYQAQKTLDETYAEKIRRAPTSDDAKKLGNSPECIVRSDWDTWKIVAMRKALAAKFSQHDELKQYLLDSGDKVLVEDSEKDYFWGIGADGTGKSMLGTLLMELRDKIRKEEK